jgi:hypothetical protein
MNSSDPTRHDDSSGLQWQKAHTHNGIDNDGHDEEDDDDDNYNSQLFSVRTGWNSISRQSRQSTQRPETKDFRPLTKMQMQLAELQGSKITGGDISSSNARGGGGVYKPSSLELAISKAQAQRSMRQQVYGNSSNSFSGSGDAVRGEIVSLVSRDHDEDDAVKKIGRSVDQEDEDELVPEQKIIRKKGGVK